MSSNKCPLNDLAHVIRHSIIAIEAALRHIEKEQKQCPYAKSAGSFCQPLSPEDKENSDA